MLDSESSLRLNLLRFPLIVGVVFLHANESTVGLSWGEVGVVNLNFISEFVIDLISVGFSQISVPLFFLMSGYLFFWNFTGTVESFLFKMRKRISTLVVPFLAWNLLTLSIYLLAQNMPAAGVFITGHNQDILDYQIFDYVNAIIGINRLPIAYHFWFIRDLILLVAVTPFIDWLIKNLPFYFFGFIAVCWLMDFWPLYIPSSGAVLFFSTGAGLASTRKRLFSADVIGKKIIGLYLILAIIDALTVGHTANHYIHKISILMGLLAALSITRFVVEHELLTSLLVSLSKASFFVYAIHEPLLTILRKIFYKIFLPEASFTILTIYFVTPTLTILLSIMTFLAFRGTMPKLLRIVTGGR
jgi:peptidoglycan/LPS O-acetylase OafA/YrhL